ncbi:MAG: DNA repair protein RadC [Clostridia bacterium]|nr:DNA repair protein RadC [Clostridia bacterium]
MRRPLRHLPPDERPRERLLRLGAAALSNRELLAILLRTGHGAGGRSALDLAADVLAAGGDRGLAFLVTATPEELAALPGVGPAKAAQVLAGVELGRRVVSQSRHRPLVRTPADVAALLMEQMRHLEVEHVRTVLLDTKHRVMAVEEVSVGTLDASLVDPRAVFRGPVRRNAAAIILAHNHPSGDPEPSAEDEAVTARLVEAGRLLGIEVLDHLVFGDNRFVSLRERGFKF